MVTDLFSRAGEEIEKRYLSTRESVRIGKAAIYAMNRIKFNFENNKKIRTDDFFVRDLTNRSAADEILEGTLIAAKNEYEEKKIDYYGNLLGNIPFHSEIDRYHAHYLLRIVEGLSYRQICILALFKRKLDYHLSSDIQELQQKLNQNEMIIFREIAEIKILNLLTSTNNYLMGGGPAGNITPGTIELSNTGNIIYTMMNLDEIDRSEIDGLAVILSNSIPEVT